MDRKMLEEITRKLHKQRKAYLKEFREAEANLRFIAEDRESEPEELAQEDRAAQFLLRLDDHAIRQAEEIDAAIERIATGTYGKCQGCGKTIPVTRLRFLPATRYCVACAGKSEKIPSAAGAEIRLTVKPTVTLGS